MARILVADDEPTVRQLIRVVLEREGHEVIEAATGRAVIECLESSGCDIAVLDLMMPEMSGWAAIDYLREHQPKMLRCVIVVTASHEQDIEARFGPEPRPFRVIQKPFDVAKIAAAIRECPALSDRPAKAEEAPSPYGDFKR